MPGACQSYQNRMPCQCPCKNIFVVFSQQAFHCPRQPLPVSLAAPAITAERTHCCSRHCLCNPCPCAPLPCAAIAPARLPKSIAAFPCHCRCTIAPGRDCQRRHCIDRHCRWGPPPKTGGAWGCTGLSPDFPGFIDDIIFPPIYDIIHTPPLQSRPTPGITCTMGARPEGH